MNLFAIDTEEAEVLSGWTLPCFVYRLDLARERWRSLRAALPAAVRIAYAVKSNPHPALVSSFAELGADFDTASIGELELLSKIPHSGGLLFAGPGKTRAELDRALELGARIEIDGPEDIAAIEALLSARPELGPRGEKLALSIRVHPARDRCYPRYAGSSKEMGAGFSERNAIIGGTSASAFGVDEEDLEDFLKEAARARHIKIAGLQVFASSNEKDAESLLASHRAALEIGRELEGLSGTELDLIDLGGGLGIPYSEAEHELDIRALGSGLKELLAENSWFAGRLLVEPGRWLSGPCGVYMAHVVRVKKSRGTDFTVLEGGINHLLRPLLTGQPFPVCALRPGQGEIGGPLFRQVLAGPLCSSLDRLGTVLLPELKAGDIVLFGQAGAYGFSESMSLFLSHPQAAEYALDGPPQSGKEPLSLHGSAGYSKEHELH